MMFIRYFCLFLCLFCSSAFSSDGPPSSKHVPEYIVNGLKKCGGLEFLHLYNGLISAKNKYKYDHLSFLEWQKEWELRRNSAVNSMQNTLPKLIPHFQFEKDKSLLKKMMIAFDNLGLSRIQYNNALIQIMRKNEHSNFLNADRVAQSYFSDFIKDLEVTKNIDTSC